MAGQSPPCLNPNWLFEVARQQNDYLAWGIAVVGWLVLDWA